MSHVKRVPYLVAIVLAFLFAVGVVTDLEALTQDGTTVSPTPTVVSTQVDQYGAPVQVATTVVDPEGNGQPPVLDQPVPVDANIIMWLTVLGVISSLATSAISRGFPGDSDDAKMRRAMALAVVCLVVAVGDVFIRGVMNTSNYLASFLAIAVTAIGFYKGWSATSTIAGKLAGTR